MSELDAFAGQDSRGLHTSLASRALEESRAQIFHCSPSLKM